jgi:hypothetical protein
MVSLYTISQFDVHVIDSEREKKQDEFLSVWITDPAPKYCMANAVSS